MEKYFQIFKSLNESLVQQINVDIPVLLKYYLLIKFEIIITALISYFVVKVIRDGVYYIYNKLKYKLVRRPRFLIEAYRMYIGIDGLLEFIIYKILRVGVGISYERNLTDYILEDSILEKTKSILVGIFRPTEITNLISFGTAVYICYNLPINELIPKYIEIESRGKSLFVSLLIYLPALIIILGIFVAWRYTGIKGRFIRGANRVNQRMIEDILDIHRRLIKLVLQIIDKGAENVDRITKCRDLLLTNRINEISPIIEDVQGNKVIWNNKFSGIWNNSRFNIELETIEEIEDIIEILKEAKEKNIIDELFWIRLYSRKMRGLKEFMFRSPNEFGKYLRRELLTPYYVKKLYKKDTDEVLYEEIKDSIPSEKERVFIERDILDDIREFELMVDDKIISSVEILVEFGYYYNETYKLLHFNSNKFGRILEMITGRE